VRLSKSPQGGERSVSSHACTSAPCTVMGMKMLDSPMLLWSRKLWASVLKGVGVEQPAVNWNLHTKLVLFITFAMQREIAVAIRLRVGKQ